VALAKKTEISPTYLARIEGSAKNPVDPHAEPTDAAEALQGAQGESRGVGGERLVENGWMRG
jgi:hypothetical protein